MFMLVTIVMCMLATNAHAGDKCDVHAGDTHDYQHRVYRESKELPLVTTIWSLPATCGLLLTLASSETRSILLSNMRSAKASCCTASFTSPPGWYSSRCCTDNYNRMDIILSCKSLCAGTQPKMYAC